MKNEKRFYRTLNALKRAYIKNQFDLMLCSQCPAAIILADHYGVDPTKENHEKHYFYWHRAVWSQPKSCMYKGEKRAMYEEGMKVIKGCGYNVSELTLIENASFRKSSMLEVIIAVYDAVAKIHQVEDKLIKEKFINELDRG